jgi:HlyD family secretion protein
MKPRDILQNEVGAGIGWVSEPSGPEAAGPQGNALILELQRLRQAFDDDENPQTMPARVRVPRGRTARQRPPMRKQKSMIGRAIDVWLEQLGFNSPAPSPRQRQASPRPRKPSPWPRDPSPWPRDPSPRQGDPSLRQGEPSPRQRDPSLAPPARPSPTITIEPRAGRAARPSREPDHAGNKPPAGPVNRPLAPINAGPPPGRRVAAPVAAPRRDLAVAGGGKPPSTTAFGRALERSLAGVAFLVERDALADNDNAPGDSLAVRTGRAYKRELRTGLRALIIGGVLGGGWLTLVPLAGAVVVPGTLVVQSNVKTIQHPTGGVVAQIPVQNGMRVKAGDLLLRLDPTQAQASLETVSKQLDDARARIARLVAERDGQDRPGIPPEFSARMNEDSVKNTLASEEALFKARFSTHQSQRELLENRVSQLGEEIKGLNSQIESKAKELELITSELTGVQELYDKRLVPLTRLTTLQRDRTRIEGERGQLVSAIAETKAKIGEAQLQIVKIDQDFRSDVVKELGETQGKEAELEQKAVSARDIIARIDLRAPTSGLIHQLVAHTIGGVIKAGDPIMEIVPDSDDLQIEAKLDPKDIDQVRTGQKAFVKFSAFNARVTPEVTGDVSYVSADTSKEAQGPQQPFYTVRVTLPEEERRKLDGEQLVSGMPAEVFMQTGSRTMLTYLFKPIMEQLGRAFVER